MGVAKVELHQPSPKGKIMKLSANMDGVLIASIALVILSVLIHQLMAWAA